ncbi:ATP-binding protein [Amycolatopsis sp.]|uniref:ATP-binding protein n=1 Tax=Amycolatopsis sp. TaxID=37632 RepID=UPI002D806F37|nr:ATP-binding protein [Amycolatopsis sp.]HET6709147.1 ATP-binding protein [Amycolatopsis sp.]
MSPAPLLLSVGRDGETTVARVTGELNLASYPVLRDGLLKIATDAPEGLVADISELAIADSSLVSVFPLVAMRIGDWPAIPFTVVASAGHRVALSRHVADRCLPVRTDLAAATAALDHPVRRRCEHVFPRSDDASAQIRDLVTDKLGEWGAPELAEDARLIATELVENVLRHTTSAPKLRLDLRRGVCTVAVADQDTRPAVLLERLSPFEPGMGLKLVAQIARVWGCSRSWAGGKVVWAVLLPSARTIGDRPAG